MGFMCSFISDVFVFLEDCVFGSDPAPVFDPDVTLEVLTIWQLDEGHDFSFGQE